MRNALTDSQAALQKADLERTRALKDLSTTLSTLDSQKIETEKLTAQLETLRAKHETDMATMRKHTAGLQRDKSDLNSTLEGLKTEIASKARGIKRSGSKQEGIEGLGGDEDDRFEDEEGLEDDEDVFRAGARRKTGEGFLPGSPGDLFSEFGDESESNDSPAFQRDLNSDDSLKSGLAHAQRTIATLRTSLAREKAAKMELRRQLAGGAGGNESWEDESEMGTPARGGLLPGSARRARGSARGRGSASRRGARGGAAAHGPSRLAKEFAGDSSIDSIDEEEVVDSFDSPGDGASIFEHQFPASGGGVEDDDMLSEGFDSPIPTRPRHRSHNSVHSIDMDPAFAHHHHESDDNASIRSRDSCAPQSTLADVLGSNGRPASIISFNKSNRPTSAMFSGFDIEQEASMDSITRPAPLVFTDVGVMTDPLPEPALLGALDSGWGVRDRVKRS